MNDLLNVRNEALAIAEMAFVMNDAPGTVAALMSVDAAEFLMNDETLGFEN